MNCKPCRRLVFDWRDGSLPAFRSEAVQAHLSRCADCRAFYENERLLGGRIGEAFGPALAGSRVFARELLAGAPVDRSRGARRLRFLIPAGAAAAILAGLIIYRALPLPRLIEPTSPETVVLDDFPDPLRDWAEGRVIFTVEDAARGTKETFLQTRDGSVRRVADKGTNP
jgi:hypothetical protein